MADPTRAGRVHGPQAEVRYERRYPPLINAAPETAICTSVLQAMVGAEHVLRAPPTMGSEGIAALEPDEMLTLGVLDKGDLNRYPSWPLSIP